MSIDSYDLDMDGIDVDTCDKEGGVPAGWYQAVCTNVGEDVKFAGVLKFDFRVTLGKWRGHTIHASLWGPDLAEDASKAATARKKMAGWAKRLGLLPSPIDWTRAIGQTVALQMKTRSYTDKDGNPKTTTDVDFLGIFQATDERVPDEVRLKGAPPSDSGAGDTVTAPPKPPAPAAPRKPKFDVGSI